MCRYITRCRNTVCTVWGYIFTWFQFTQEFIVLKLSCVSLGRDEKHDWISVFSCLKSSLSNYRSCHHVISWNSLQVKLEFQRKSNVDKQPNSTCIAYVFGRASVYPLINLQISECPEIWEGVYQTWGLQWVRFFFKYVHNLSKHSKSLCFTIFMN